MGNFYKDHDRYIQIKCLKERLGKTGAIVNDTERILFILHWEGLETIDVFSQDPICISVVTQHAREAAEKEVIIFPSRMCLHRCE